MCNNDRIHEGFVNKCYLVKNIMHSERDVCIWVMNSDQKEFLMIQII